MAVDALDLKPRGPIALFDAAVRVCATSAGVWALTLPAGAALVAALFNLAEAVRRYEALTTPVALLTLAWCFRAVSQGAACHFLEQQVLGPGEPGLRTSFLAALKRAPSLVTTAAVCGTLNAAIWLFTAGIGFFFVGAHAAAYATTMRGEGGALRVYGTSARLLGPAKHTAAWVRLCGLTQLLVGLNLHLAVALTLYLGRAVMGLDLTFVDRFASLDNPTWLATVAAMTFALFEPLRAATGTLLLIDGRVRQEGLDLAAAVEQLPRRRPVKSAVVTVALLALAAWPASAEAKSALRDRVDRVIARCEVAAPPDTSALDGLEALRPGEQSALERFVARVERTAIDDEDCDAAEADLYEGLTLFREALRTEPADAASTRDAAKAILARPEFQVAPERPKAEEPDEPSRSWLGQLWDDFWKAIWEWLRNRDRDATEPIAAPAGGMPMVGANAVMLVAIAVVAFVLVLLLLRGWRRKRPDDASVDESGAVSEEALSDDPMSALSRPPEGWAGLADQLAAQGQFREAIRHLYLALLSRLHRDGAIDYDPTCSNWEYLSNFKGPGELKRPFRELTRRFDFAWYGNLDANELAWAMFRQTAEPLLAPREPEATARA